MPHPNFFQNTQPHSQPPSPGPPPISLVGEGDKSEITLLVEFDLLEFVTCDNGGEVCVVRVMHRIEVSCETF